MEVSLFHNKRTDFVELCLEINKRVWFIESPHFRLPMHIIKTAEALKDSRIMDENYEKGMDFLLQSNVYKKKCWVTSDEGEVRVKLKNIAKK